ncbi:MAG: hypothetical protein J0L99_00490 [Chitinophagales bacterium]|nr:hypothetical protein [Chitinophagales bacterium]
MNMDNFEHKAKNLFEHYQPESENDQIWNNIEPHLKKKKKRRFIIWFFVGAGLGLLGLLGIGGEAGTRAAAPPAVVQNTSAGSRAGMPETKASPASEVTAAVEIITNSEPTRQADARTPSAKSPGTAVQKQARVMQISKSGENKPDGVANNLQEAMPSAPASETAAAAPASATTLTDTPATGSSKDSSAVRQKSVLKKSNAGHTAKTAQKDKDKDRRRKKTHNTSLISFQSGLFLPIKLLSDNPERADVPGLLKNRRSSESQLEAFNVGGMYTLALRKGLIFRTGLEFRQMTEKFLVEFQTEEVDYRQGVVSQTVDGNGLVIAQQMGLKKITTIRNYRNVAYNRVQMFNLPLGAGYRIQHKKYAFEWVGGMDLNLFFGMKGTMYNVYGYPSSVGSEQVFRKRVGLGIWGHVLYSRPINRVFSWQTGLQVQTPLGKVTQADYALNQRYFNVGIQGGVSCNLNPKPIKGKSAKTLKKR